MKMGSYVLIKENQKFPFIKIGSDFDIYVLNIDKTEKEIIGYFNVIPNFKTTRIYCDIGHNQIDLFYNDRFIYKFDLYGTDYTSSTFNDIFIEDVIQNCLQKKFYFFKKFNISIPTKDMDIMIRIFELYLYPEKKHHKDVLKNNGVQYTESINDQILRYSKIDISKLYLGF
jgi:hypothetical protein